MVKADQSSKMEETYAFNLGEYKFLVIRDTTGPLHLEGLFPSVSPADMTRYLNQYAVPRGDFMEILCLLVRTPQQLILIDTGWGAGTQPQQGRLVSILRNNGIEQDAINVVINSHGHPDHIGGNTDQSGKPIYPKARYIMLEKEWDFWTSVPDLSHLDQRIQDEMHAFVRKNMTPLRQHFTLVGEKEEFIPGFKLITAPGHSQYQSLVSISTGGRQLLYLSDLVHHPVQIARPEIGVFGDFVPDEARRTRIAVMNQTAESGALLFACHFPFPGLGHIQRKGDRLAWQPLAPGQIDKS